EYEMTIRLERMRVREALAARDAAVKHLAEACASVREKTAVIKRLSDEKERLEKQLERLQRGTQSPTDETAEERGGAEHAARSPVIRELLECVQTLEERLASVSMSENCSTGRKTDDEADYREMKQKLNSMHNAAMKVLSAEISGADVLKDISNTVPSNECAIPTAPRDFDTPSSPWTPIDGERLAALPTANTAEKIEARYAVLASLPLPSGIPDDALTPIVIPAPYTLHDFIGTTSGSLRSQIGNYRVFQQATTTWCPEREEHGYYLTPVFKCSTNPRVSTAHRWSAVDITAKLDKPTAECFFNKDGKWYYAGTYKFFRLEDLCPQEWECLSTETSQALIKETLAGRKNSSPQNVYETGQLYSAGALKVACIGLQCIGFNDVLYRGLLEHAAHCALTGRWRATGHGYSSAGCGAGTGLGFGAGTTWTVKTSVHPTPLSPPACLSSPAGNVSPGAASLTPGSPVASFGSPPQHVSRVLGLVPVLSSVRSLQHGGQDISVVPGTRAPGKA
ncbi:hypothetical protein BD414DRAFT_424545, partial [Trametes punicea]